MGDVNFCKRRRRTFDQFICLAHKLLQIFPFGLLPSNFSSSRRSLSYHKNRTTAQCYTSQTKPQKPWKQAQFLQIRTHKTQNPKLKSSYFPAKATWQGVAVWSSNPTTRRSIGTASYHRSATLIALSSVLVPPSNGNKHMSLSTLTSTLLKSAAWVPACPWPTCSGGVWLVRWA